MKEINYTELLNWINENKDFQLIDVREPEEHQAFNIGGLLIPLGELNQKIREIEEGIPIVIYCKRGIRSQIAIQRLQIKRPNQTFFNLKDGILTLIKENSEKKH